MKTCLHTAYPLTQHMKTQTHPSFNPSSMTSPSWNWRMRAATTPGEAITPTPSLIWLGANLISPTHSHPYNLLTGGVLTHPSVQPTEIRVRLFQEVAIRRDGGRRRARSQPCQSAVAAQWAPTVTLGTGVHKGGVVADSNIACVNAVPSTSTDDSVVRQWMFAARLPRQLQRTWTWAACEGDRKKIWFLDIRYRVVAEAFRNGELVAAARSFVIFSPTPTDLPPRIGRNRASSSNLARPSSHMLHSAEHAHNPLPTSDSTSPEPESDPASASSSEEEPLLQRPPNAFRFRRRTAMAFSRSSHTDDTPKRPRHPESKPIPVSKRAPSALGIRGNRSVSPYKDSTSFAAHPREMATRTSYPSSQGKKPSWGAFTSTEDFDDMAVTTTLQVPSQPTCPHNHAQFKLTEQVTATINLAPKVSLCQLKVTAVLTEIIEIVDDTGTRQVHLQHHHRMFVSPVPSTASRRQEISCVAQMTVGDKLFSADASFDYMSITHRLDVSVSYERRRVLGGLLFGEVAPAEHDLWDIVDGTGMKVVSSTPLCLRHGEKPEQQTTVPWLAVWGSTERIAAVGTDESRVPRRKPNWATSDSVEAQTENMESKIDALRSLAYANSGARRREESPDGRGEDELRRFPTFIVDDNGPLSKQSCPVCLEQLDGAVTMLPCLHAGHRSCFGRSQNRALMCPVCRLDLSPFVVDGEPPGIGVQAA